MNVCRIYGALCTELLMLSALLLLTAVEWGFVKGSTWRPDPIWVSIWQIFTAPFVVYVDPGSSFDGY